MTNNQENLIRFIADYRVKYGTSPTLQEMVKGIGVSDHKSVSGIIAALMKQGYLEKGKQKNRSILLTDNALKFLGVPLLRRQQLEEYSFSYKPKIQASTSLLNSSTDFVAYGKQPIKTDGTNLDGDIRLVVETAVGLAIDNYFNGSSYQDAKQVISDGVIRNATWAILISGLTWLGMKIFGDSLTAFVYAIATTLIIKYFLTDKNYESRN